MKTQTTLSRALGWVALGSALVLSIPLIAMQFTPEVNWSVGDFMLMGALLFITGSAYVLLARLFDSFIHRIAAAWAIGSTFLLIWVNLAVGLIGSGPHWGNYMYLGVLVVGLLGLIFSNFSTQGLERALYAMTGSVVVIALIALLAGAESFPGSSVKEIIGVNTFFAMLFAVGGILFRYAGHVKATAE
ncbi:hypothetical protein QWY31_00480 [Cytophagales bacterium LB-30]|uniref:DUF308 domain-containing protein n=1 Tax=Shiella aurantiaca TaxID=3058365 RepID=A0ABT8F0H9_9BACT|nr:hypothetical protein [Shiella aurantiaca]MDN4163951.1 hypothetical protein [Shiella aurantiaca]